MNIPETAKKVFKGVLFDVYHWEQKLYDGSTTTFEMIARAPSLDVIATIDNKIITLMQEQPTKPLFPSLPGGRVEENENPLTAAKRELLEETGCESNDWIKFGEWVGRSKIFFPETTFIARNCKKVTNQHLDGGEKITTKLVTFEEFLQLCRDPQFTAPLELKFMMYEALLDDNKKKEFKKKIFD